MTKSSIMRTAIAVTFVAMVIASETGTVPKVRTARIVKGASVQKNAINTLPVSRNTRRRVEDVESDPKKVSPGDESKLPKETETTTDAKQPIKDDKAKKEMEASNFEQLNASNDCKVGRFNRKSF
jgi:hypothetical protein